MKIQSNSTMIKNETGLRGRGLRAAVEQPLVSIVTPSFQSGRFIQQTIESVLAQTYPRLEYIVMDGGSTDGTLDILERYRDRLQYFSGLDGGAADAINRGFGRCHGSIFAWLSADDIYSPQTVEAVVRHFTASAEADVIYGEGIWIDEKGTEIGRYPTEAPYHAGMFEQECAICQPATFMRREVFEAAGMLRKDLHYAFDYDLWIRLSRTRRFDAIPNVLAGSRMHRENKTLGSRRRVFEENIDVLRRHYAYVPLNWIYGYLSYLKDGRDQFFDSLSHSLLIYLTSLPAGLKYNHRHPWRYIAEWGSKLTGANFHRFRKGPPS
jgi:glycosyltransferase involved in cell wall biosynthesis